MTDRAEMSLFNLKTVAAETGLKPDTLRAWERRYGMPSPTRTPGGHRLYSQSDIDLLHWLLARQAEGLSIRRAVEIRAQMSPAADTSPDSAHVQGAAATAEAATGKATAPLLVNATAPQPVSPKNESVIQMLRGRWVDGCLGYNEAEVERTLSEAFALFSPEMVCLQIIQKGLAFIGDSWYKGRVTVQQEHFASALALRRLEAIISATPLPTRAGRILIACPPGEDHTFAPLLLSLLLRRRGWAIVYLGVNAPLQQLEATIAATRPHLVVLAAQRLATAAGVLEMGNILLRARIPLAYGGLAFNRLPELQALIPGHYLGNCLEQAPALIEKLMAAPRCAAAQQTTPQAYREALRAYMERRPHIETAIGELTRNGANSPRMLATANLHFGRNIEAALILGNMQLADADIKWLEGLFANHTGISPEQSAEYLTTYLAACLAATRAQLGASAAPLVAWLTAFTEDTGSYNNA